MNVPRGKELFAPFRTVCRDALKDFASIPILVIGGVAFGMFGQPNSVLKERLGAAICVALLHLGLALWYLRWKPRPFVRWVVVILSILVLTFLIEGMLRIFLGFELIPHNTFGTV